MTSGKSETLLNLCKDCNAGIYISGPAAKDYLDVDLFKSNDIHIEWMDYSGYKEHAQLYTPFEPNVSIIDLIFNEGPNAKYFMKSFKI